MSSALSRYWPTYLAIAAVLAATILGWYWIWGVVFLIWSVRAFLDRETTLVQDVSQEDAPVLFWVLTLLWFVLSLWMIAADAIPLLGGSNA